MALQQLRQLGLVEISQGDGVKVLDWRVGAHFSVLHENLVGFLVVATCRGCGSLNTVTGPALR